MEVWTEQSGVDPELREKSPSHTHKPHTVPVAVGGSLRDGARPLRL